MTVVSDSDAKRGIAPACTVPAPASSSCGGRCHRSTPDAARATGCASRPTLGNVPILGVLRSSSGWSATYREPLRRAVAAAASDTNALAGENRQQRDASEAESGVQVAGRVVGVGNEGNGVAARPTDPFEYEKGGDALAAGGRRRDHFPNSSASVMFIQVGPAATWPPSSTTPRKSYAQPKARS